MRSSLLHRALASALLLAAACTPAAPINPTESPTASGRAVGYPGWPGPASEVVPTVVSSELAVGENRFLLFLRDAANEPLGAEERGVTMRFFDLAADATTPASTVEAAYMPTIGNLPGLYRANVTFARAGDWGVEVVTDEPDGSSRTGRMVFSVRETSSTPAVGAQAPASETPTADTAAEIAQISTDNDPDPAFYRTSVDEALSDGRPFLLVFATPAFCRTATCGPALDIIKSVAPEYADRVEFIHVEPYELESVDGQLRPALRDGQLVPVEAVGQWGLLTEPYIFVVDADGTVTAKLEGVASEAEIRAALEQVSR